MTGYSARLPLQYSESDGPYTLNKDLKDVIRQNLKMLILTNPGERVMNVDYGVGAKRLLFENRSSSAVSYIQSAILSQISKYMAFIIINSINVQTTDTNMEIDENTAYISLDYSIPSLKTEDSISLILSSN